MKIGWLVGLAGLGVASGIVSVYLYQNTPHHEPPIHLPANPYPAGIYATGIIEGLQNSGQNIQIYPEFTGVVAEIMVQEGDKVKASSPLLKLDDRLAKAQLAQAEGLWRQRELAYHKLEQARSFYFDAVSQADLDDAKTLLDQAHAAYRQAELMVEKCTLSAPVDTVVLGINVAPGSLVSPTGTFNSYTYAMGPVVELMADHEELAVRCYVDEMLVHQLPQSNIKGLLLPRGIQEMPKIPLEFVRCQPHSIPKLELSDGTMDKIDVRVVPLIFKFKKTDAVRLYPGQLADIYLEVGHD